MTRSACGQQSKGLCLKWDGPGKLGLGDQKGEEEKRTESAERTGERGQAGEEEGKGGSQYCRGRGQNHQLASQFHNLLSCFCVPSSL